MVPHLTTERCCLLQLCLAPLGDYVLFVDGVCMCAFHIYNMHTTPAMAVQISFNSLNVPSGKSYRVIVQPLPYQCASLLLNIHQLSSILIELGHADSVCNQHARAWLG